MPKWIQKWKVPSNTSDKVYTVSIAEDGTWGCSCPAWKFHRKQCDHIKDTQSKNLCDTLQAIGTVVDKPEYTLANVTKPTVKNGKLLIPLLRLPDEIMMEATIVYHMILCCYSWDEIKRHRRVPRSWTAGAVVSYVEANGEVEYPPDEGEDL